MVTADIFVKSDALPNPPIEGAAVSVLDPATFAEVAFAVTGADGKATFLLPGGTYEVRLFKLGMRFLNPFRVLVQDPVVTTNQFDVTGTVLSIPAATDPRVCRCTGRFMDLGNSPIPNATVRVMAKVESGTQSPKVVDGNMLSQQVKSLKTDANGQVTVDLVRGGEFFVMFSGEDEVAWPMRVPDRSSANLVDLIHPYPVILAWDPADAPGNGITVAVGEVKTVRYTVTFSDYHVESVNSLSNVRILNSDAALADVGSSGSTVAVRGLAEGSVEVLAEAIQASTPIRVPQYELSFSPLSVVVTP